MTLYNVVISVGCFTIEEVKHLRVLHNKIALDLWEPHPEVAKGFEIAFEDNSQIRIIQQAISDKEGFADLYLAGQSSSLTLIEGVPLVKVRTRTLASALYLAESMYGVASPKILFMNCEGEEIPIIQQTPMEELLKFKRIQIEFHPKLYSDEVLQSCVNKLTKHFTLYKSYGSVSKHPRFNFILND